MSYRIELGRRGEALAADYLLDHGHRVLDRNWRCDLGELDLVTAIDHWIIAVEVKTRSSTAEGHPFEAVDARKLARLHRLGTRWCADHRVSVGRLRIDVVGVLLPKLGASVVEHLEGVR